MNRSYLSFFAWIPKTGAANCSGGNVLFGVEYSFVRGRVPPVKTIASVTDVSEDVSGFVKKADAEGIVPISRSGRTVAFLVSREKLAALLETMELQADGDLMALVKGDRAGKLKFSPVPNAL